MYNDLGQSDTTSDVETAGYQLADWLIENNIIEQIFGPNLHIEVRFNHLTIVSLHCFTLFGNSRYNTG